MVQSMNEGTEEKKREDPLCDYLARVIAVGAAWIVDSCAHAHVGKRYLIDVGCWVDCVGQLA